MPVYRIEFKPSAARELESLPRDAQRRIARVIDGLATTPRPSTAKKLTGAADLYRLRAGDYRIIYQIRDSVLLVLVVKIGNRKDVYR